jgi:hypothetical protein
MASPQQKREEEIERLAREVGRLIRDAEPETQHKPIFSALPALTIPVTQVPET